MRHAPPDDGLTFRSDKNNNTPADKRTSELFVLPSDFLAIGKFLVFCQRTDRTLEAAHLLASVDIGKASKKAALHFSFCIFICRLHLINPNFKKILCDHFF
jgi:hypothetical protein